MYCRSGRSIHHGVELRLIHHLDHRLLPVPGTTGCWKKVSASITASALLPTRAEHRGEDADLVVGAARHQAFVNEAAVWRRS